MLKTVGMESASRAEAFNHMAGSHFQPALDMANQALSSQPDDHESAMERCEILRDMGRFKESIEGYTQLISCSQHNQDLLAELYYDRGTTYQASGNTTHNIVKALYDFEACLQIDPDHYDAHVRFADMCQEIGDRKLAMKSAEAAIALNPECCYGYILRARLNIEQKIHDQSGVEVVIKDMDKAIGLGNPKNDMDLMPLNWPLFRQVLDDLKNLHQPSAPKFEQK